MQRAWDRPLPLPLAFFAQVDQRDVRPSDQSLRVVDRKGPAAPRDLLLMQALMDVGRHGDVHHLGLGR